MAKKNNVIPDGLGEYSFNGNRVALESIAEDLKLGKPTDRALPLG